MRRNVWRRIAAALLTVILVCSLSVPAFAATETQAVQTQAVQTAASKKKIVFIGDSRTANLRQEQMGGKLVYDLLQQDGSVLWDFKWGAKFIDMTTTLVPRLELSGLDTIDSKTKIVLWMGYNDAVGTPTASADEYVNYYNLMSLLWEARGAKVYVVNVGPAGRLHGGATKAQQQEYKDKNKKIRAFNKTLKNGLRPEIKYIDIYANLMETDYATSDGTHYRPLTSKGIYRDVMKAVK
ncbi:MAG: SGNH/GDSL hydrolase family protein [Clostridia bacterium]|nr:SGNH/GDSL hydrolase family protein [Clostridia bacterium]MBR5753636.1 SGNH/GDSL hydrolase family protein [Clostridia bacterium]